MKKIGNDLVVDIPVTEEYIEMFLKCVKRAIEQEKDFESRIELHGLLGYIKGMKKIFEVEKQLYLEKQESHRC